MPHLINVGAIPNHMNVLALSNLHLTKPKERHQWQPCKFLFTVDLGSVFVAYVCKSHDVLFGFFFLVCILAIFLSQCTCLHHYKI